MEYTIFSKVKDTSIQAELETKQNKKQKIYI